MGLSKRQQKRLTRRRQKAQRKTNKRRNKNKRGGRKSRVKRQRKRGGAALGAAARAAEQQPFPKIDMLDVYKALEIKLSFEINKLENIRDMGDYIFDQLNQSFNEYSRNLDDTSWFNKMAYIAVLRCITTTHTPHNNNAYASYQPQSIALMAEIGNLLNAKLKDVPSKYDLCDNDILHSIFIFELNELESNRNLSEISNLDYNALSVFIKDFIYTKQIVLLRYKKFNLSIDELFNIIPEDIRTITNPQSIIRRGFSFYKKIVDKIENSLFNMENTIFNMYLYFSGQSDDLITQLKIDHLTGTVYKTLISKPLELNKRILSKIEESLGNMAEATISTIPRNSILDEEIQTLIELLIDKTKTNKRPQDEDPLLDRLRRIKEMCGILSSNDELIEYMERVESGKTTMSQPSNSDLYVKNSLGQRSLSVGDSVNIDPVFDAMIESRMKAIQRNPIPEL